jgi:hypothetical protein
MKTPESLIPALRQYRHNHECYGNDFVTGFDHDLTVKAFSELEQKNKEIVKLLKDAAQFINIALNHEGDVFGVNHNDVMDLLSDIGDL